MIRKDDTETESLDTLIILSNLGLLGGPWLRPVFKVPVGWTQMTMWPNQHGVHLHGVRLGVAPTPPRPP